MGQDTQITAQNGFMTRDLFKKVAAGRILISHDIHYTIIYNIMDKLKFQQQGQAIGYF